ncbi:MAG: hypothetical protein ACRDL5_02500 [Solirubrobacteraceae bacterium]
MAEPPAASVGLSAAIEKLVAARPTPELAEKLMLYGRFVGSWRIESVNYDEHGQRRRERTGEWHFAWILGGRGVQDVLYAAGSPPEDFGTTLRCYDHLKDVWHVSWMQPADGEFVHLIGRETNGQIVQIGTGPDPSRQERWTFSEITANSFVWQGEVSRDGGQTWRLMQEMQATRTNG